MSETFAAAPAKFATDPETLIIRVAASKISSERVYLRCNINKDAIGQNGIACEQTQKRGTDSQFPFDTLLFASAVGNTYCGL
ncbi:MAG: hypothetical protein K0S33_408 [Bacteroidetes bacterium]|jgi:hypothetical protein|nr:hypothetical protein [Bacteroidota bacterium]